jgi:hypothetical protein
MGTIILIIIFVLPGGILEFAKVKITERREKANIAKGQT